MTAREHVRDGLPPGPPLGPRAAERHGRWAGHAAWGWVIVFIAAHVYWFAGGRFGHPNALPDASLDLFSITVAAMFVLGAVAPLASVRDWGRRIPRGPLLATLWTGCVILLLRGVAGVVDEALRVTEIAPNGLLGLTREQVTGSAHPSDELLWSGRAIDAYFTLGGVLFGVAAAAFQRGSSLRERGERPART